MCVFLCVFLCPGACNGILTARGACVTQAGSLLEQQAVELNEAVLAGLPALRGNTEVSQAYNTSFAYALMHLNCERARLSNDTYDHCIDNSKSTWRVCTCVCACVCVCAWQQYGCIVMGNTLCCFI